MMSTFVDLSETSATAPHDSHTPPPPPQLAGEGIHHLLLQQLARAQDQAEQAGGDAEGGQLARPLLLASNSTAHSCSLLQPGYRGISLCTRPGHEEMCQQHISAPAAQGYLPHLLHNSSRLTAEQRCDSNSSLLIK
ncbi:hypothetical protein O3P69_015527 [Scylla paramamosain]|uniref:Uncharacterized protein n=1 Tax=Scylla paramamosain TaxID=85552 RepID=A0AAW0SC69_SCYPA